MKGSLLIVPLLFSSAFSIPAPAKNTQKSAPRPVPAPVRKAAAAAPKLHFEAIVSDKMVDVGDLDYFHALWEVLYEQSNQNGGMSDRTYYTFNSPCQHKNTAKPKLMVTVHLEGQWGKANGLSSWQVRDALVQAMYETTKKIAATTSYQMYSGCLGTTWQEGIGYNMNAACGLKGRPDCLCDGGGAQCDNSVMGKKLPAEIKIQTYAADGALLPDSYQVSFTSSQPTVTGGCGKFGAIAEVFLSFVPGVGGYCEKAVKIACRR